MGNVLLLRMNETEREVPPADDVAALDDLAPTAGTVLPDLVDAQLGRGRRFVSADAVGLVAQDIDPGSTLLTRTMSIQVALSWDAEAAGVYGSPGTIYARGKGGSSVEYLSAGLEIRVINAATRIGEVRWLWQDLAGVLKTQIGGHFQAPTDGELLITATRRWISATRVVLRYFLGDQLLAEVESSDGSIGGGTTGTTSLGARYSAGWGRYLDGVIDEIRVVDYELAAEEVEATWKRITIEQPRGYQLIREMHDPGFPISLDPASRVQRETRLWGDAIGFVAAQAENVRANILPDRAYGPALEQWERNVKAAPRPADDVEARRNRVVGKFRQRRGISIPGIGDAFVDLLDTDPANLEILSFSQTVADGFDTKNEIIWSFQPDSAWTIVGGELRAQFSAASAAAEGYGTGTAFWDWFRAKMSVGAKGRGVRAVVKVDPSTLTNAEMGLVFYDGGRRNAIALGFARVAGALRLRYEIVKAGVLQGPVVIASPADMSPVWLQIKPGAELGFFTSADDMAMVVGFSTVSSVGPYTWTEISAVGFNGFHWAALYARAIGATPVVDGTFDDFIVRDPFGDRSQHLYVYRDPALPGAPDYLAADGTMQGLKQAQTEAHVVPTRIAKYDDPLTTYDNAPMGGNDLE